MTAAAVSLADLGDIMKTRARRPRIRADRDLGAEAALRERDVVSRLRVKIIRNKFVVAVDAGVGQIETDDASAVAGALFDELDRLPVLFENRLQFRLNFRALQYFVERFFG